MTTNNLPLSFYIKSSLSLRYISDLSIIGLFLSYYTNANHIFFIFAPLVIVNFIVISIVQIFNFDELIDRLLINVLNKNNINSPGDISNNTYKYKYQYQIGLFIFLFHIIPVLWLCYVFQSNDIIKIYKPNFMDIFFKSIMIVIIYFLYQSKVNIYGNLNYLVYLILYIGILLGTCIYLYM